MECRALTDTRLAFENLRHKPQRTAGLVTVAALVAFVLSSGGLLAASMKNGLESTRARLGADLMVVPVGYDGGMEGIRYKQYETTLEPGCELFLYTDGVTEATDENNQLFGMDRMVEALNHAMSGSPQAILASGN